MKKLSIAFISILCVFGAVFISLLIHEGIHVLQSKSPRSVCYDMQTATLMSVVHVPGDFEGEFQEFRTYSEKLATIGQYIIILLFGFELGIISGWFKI